VPPANLQKFTVFWGGVQELDLKNKHFILEDFRFAEKLHS
jgi:hypothetical protein